MELRDRTILVTGGASGIGVVVEVKSTAMLHASAARQLDNDLHATRLEVGLLLHFGHEPRFYRVAHVSGRHASTT